MPAGSKLGKTPGNIWEIEVYWQLEAEHVGQSDGNGRIPHKIRINLNPKQEGEDHREQGAVFNVVSKLPVGLEDTVDVVSNDAFVKVSKNNEPYPGLESLPIQTPLSGDLV